MRLPFGCAVGICTRKLKLKIEDDVPSAQSQKKNHSINVYSALSLNDRLRSSTQLRMKHFSSYIGCLYTSEEVVYMRSFDVTATTDIKLISVNPFRSACCPTLKRQTNTKKNCARRPVAVERQQCKPRLCYVSRYTSLCVVSERPACSGLIEINCHWRMWSIIIIAIGQSCAHTMFCHTFSLCP